MKKTIINIVMLLSSFFWIEPASRAAEIVCMARTSDAAGSSSSRRPDSSCHRIGECRGTALARFACNAGTFTDDRGHFNARGRQLNLQAPRGWSNDSALNRQVDVNRLVSRTVSDNEPSIPGNARSANLGDVRALLPGFRFGSSADHQERTSATWHRTPSPAMRSLTARKPGESNFAECVPGTASASTGVTQALNNHLNILATRFPACRGRPLVDAATGRQTPAGDFLGECSELNIPRNFVSTECEMYSWSNGDAQNILRNCLRGFLQGLWTGFAGAFTSLWQLGEGAATVARIWWRQDATAAWNYVTEKVNQMARGLAQMADQLGPEWKCRNDDGKTNLVCNAMGTLTGGATGAGAVGRIMGAGATAMRSALQAAARAARVGGAIETVAVLGARTAPALEAAAATTNTATEAAEVAAVAAQRTGGALNRIRTTVARSVARANAAIDSAATQAGARVGSAVGSSRLGGAVVRGSIRAAEATAQRAGAISEAVHAARPVAAAREVAARARQVAVNASNRVRQGASNLRDGVRQSVREAGGRVAQGARDAGGRVAQGAREAGGRVAQGARDARDRVGQAFRRGESAGAAEAEAQAAARAVAAERSAAERLFGMEPNGSRADFVAARRRMAIELHPDRLRTDAERLAAATRARDALRRLGSDLDSRGQQHLQELERYLNNGQFSAVTPEANNAIVDVLRRGSEVDPSRIAPAATAAARGAPVGGAASEPVTGPAPRSAPAAEPAPRAAPAPAAAPAPTPPRAPVAEPVVSTADPAPGAAPAVRTAPAVETVMSRNENIAIRGLRLRPGATAEEVEAAYQSQLQRVRARKVNSAEDEIMENHPGTSPQVAREVAEAAVRNPELNRLQRYRSRALEYVRRRDGVPGTSSAPAANSP